MSFLKWLFGKRAPLQAETSLPAFSAQPGPLDGQFMTLGDRQILRDASCVLPKDTAEISRLDFQKGAFVFERPDTRVLLFQCTELHI